MVDPLPMSVSLEKVGTSQFKAVAPTGVPYDLSLPVSISSAGEIQGNAEEIRILAGSVESAALRRNSLDRHRGGRDRRYRNTPGPAEQPHVVTLSKKPAACRGRFCPSTIRQTRS